MIKIEMLTRLDIIGILLQTTSEEDELKSLYDEHTSIINELKIYDNLQNDKATEFMKNDSGKNMMSLIDPQFVVLLGEILTFGANKYAPNNWQLCEDTSRYKDALLRHLYAYLGGEQLDQESGMSHLGHAAFGLMCLNYFDNLKKDQK